MKGMTSGIRREWGPAPELSARHNVENYHPSYKVANIGDLFCNKCCKKAFRGQSDRSKRCKRFGVRLGVCMVFLTNVYGTVIFFYLFINTIYAKVLFAIYLYFMLCTVVSYFIVCFSDPGFVNRESPAYKRLASKCTLCHMSKPVRTHHCSLCDRCVLKMDHHCPWVQNCIGANNYGEFYHLIIVTTVTLILSMIYMLVAMA